tara:strand:- start:686 stop:1216 length:531 start_codon:yes stop_codon:yes gene_type:complete
MIKLYDTEIKDVKLIIPKIYNDDRGYFFESFNSLKFDLGRDEILFSQDNESLSKFGTLRGIHFQKEPYQQSKLVRVIKGKIQDVAVDLRVDSPTYRKYVSVILDDKNKKQIFIPKGFGHAFLVLSESAIVSYKVDNYYNPDFDSGIRFDDPTLNIPWEINTENIIISDKDKNLPHL